MAVVLGYGETTVYTGVPLKTDDASMSLYSRNIPRPVTIEALAESLGVQSSKSLVMNAIRELEEIYNELRISLEPKQGDAVRINTSPEELFDLSQLVVRNAMTKVEAAFSGPLLQAIEIENYKNNGETTELDVCFSFKNSTSILEKLERLFTFQAEQNLIRPSNGTILNILDLASSKDRNMVTSNVMYMILQELSLLQHNLVTLDKILENAARSDDMRSSMHLLSSLNAEMKDGELKLSIHKVLFFNYPPHLTNIINFVQFYA